MKNGLKIDAQKWAYRTRVVEKTNVLHDKHKKKVSISYYSGDENKKSNDFVR